MWIEPQSVNRVTQQIYGDFKALATLKIYSTGPICSYFHIKGH